MDNWIYFKTAIGICGISWEEKGITQVSLPEKSLKFLKTKFDGKIYQTRPPMWVKKIILKIEKHFEGNLQDFSKVPVQLNSLPPFHQKVYLQAKKIPYGKLTTYGALAKAMGNPLAARAVGQALGKNPIGLIVPCHRVVSAGGRPGGFTAHGGLLTKARMLAIEGVSL